MDWGMCLVIMFTRFWASPELLIYNTLSVLPKLIILSQSLHDVEQIYSWIVLGRLCSWVAQKPFVIQLLHMLHGLLWRDAQFSRYQFLSFHCVQRIWTSLFSLNLVHPHYTSGTTFLNFLKEN